ncbi:protein spire 1 [Caerostris extrusa]|uniref:Protein spire 1 n=1 Tax=Caerostris extrusa TaxID=172846 RepID=A0AAV4SWK2_CAEEX|nr:protein spire 1 [Caerostris extrusa]
MENDIVCFSSLQLVPTLGMVVFRALDYRIPQDEERNLSRPLESLIEKMTSTSLQEEDEDEGDDCSSQNADEGIEQDSGEDDHRILHSFDDSDVKQRRGISLVQIMELCETISLKTYRIKQRYLDEQMKRKWIAEHYENLEFKIGQDYGCKLSTS